MAGGGNRSKKGGADKNKKNQAMRQDVAARREGTEAARPKTKDNVPKAAKSGRQKSGK